MMMIVNGCMHWIDNLLGYTAFASLLLHVIKSIKNVHGDGDSFPLQFLS